jgi:hypothetical protein
MIHLDPLSQSGFETYRQQAVEEYQPLAALVEKRTPPG